MTRAEFYESINQEVPEYPGIPDCVVHVWEWFWELSAVRGAGFSSPNPIGYEQIRSWSFLMNQYITVDEVRMIIAMDATFRNVLSEEQEGMRKENEQKQNQKPAKKPKRW